MKIEEFILKDENNHYHCDNGPAINVDGFLAYCVHGEYHRLDGPAIEFASGDQSWYYNGQYIPVKSQEEFERYLKLMAFI